MYIERRVLTFSRRFLFALFVVYRGDPAALNDRWSRRMEQSMGRVIESLLTASSLFPALSRILLRGRRGGEGWKAVLMAAIGSKTNNLGGGDKGTGWCGQIIARTGGISGRASSDRRPHVLSLPLSLARFQSSAARASINPHPDLPSCRSKLSISIPRNDALLTIGYCGEPQPRLIPRPCPQHLKGKEEHRGWLASGHALAWKSSASSFFADKSNSD